MVIWVVSTEPVLTEMRKWTLVLSLMPRPLLEGGELAAHQCPVCPGETREGRVGARRKAWDTAPLNHWKPRQGDRTTAYPIRNDWFGEEVC